MTPQKPESQYRPMPRAYIVRWVLMTVLVYAAEGVIAFAMNGWPPGDELIVVFITFLIVAPIVGYLGAYLWGWIVWRVWLYRKFPPIEGFALYWYPDRSR